MADEEVGETKVAPAPRPEREQARVTSDIEPCLVEGSVPLPVPNDGGSPWQAGLPGKNLWRI